jgi:uncharacterized membrane protein YbaN (DUF454 family)
MTSPPEKVGARAPAPVAGDAPREPLEGALPPRPLPWIAAAGLWTTGTAALALGFLGIFLPLLPTTPLLLLAAACYVRVSPRAYRWLVANRLFGPVIREWRARRTVPARAKWTGVLLVFAAFAASAILVPSSTYGHVAQFVLGSSLIVFLAALPTAPATATGHPDGGSGSPPEGSTAERPEPTRAPPGGPQGSPSAS